MITMKAIIALVSDSSALISESIEEVLTTVALSPNRTMTGFSEYMFARLGFRLIIFVFVCCVSMMLPKCFLKYVDWQVRGSACRCVVDETAQDCVMCRLKGLDVAEYVAWKVKGNVRKWGTEGGIYIYPGVIPARETTVAYEF